ncbi:MAG: TetR/AcrR family transcriptional regulator [Actinobacteria bacterium]|nr:TetR/AcrR family transcriptional regulator [Actinomycetota bacterium]
MEQTIPKSLSVHRGGGERASKLQKRRSELVTAATRVIRREGPAVSMDLMAAEAGVTKPILYRHFGDRAGLCAAIAEPVLAELAEAIEVVIGKEGHPYDVIHSAIDSFLRFVEEDRNLYKFLTRGEPAEPAGPGPGLAPIEDFEQRIARQTASVIDQSLRAIGRDSEAAQAWGYAIVGMVHAAARWWLQNQSMSRSSISTRLAELAWWGLSGVGGHTSPG